MKNLIYSLSLIIFCNTMRAMSPQESTSAALTPAQLAARAAASASPTTPATQAIPAEAQEFFMRMGRSAPRYENALATSKFAALMNTIALVHVFYDNEKNALEAISLIKGNPGLINAFVYNYSSPAAVKNRFYSAPDTKLQPLTQISHRNISLFDLLKEFARVVNPFYIEYINYPKASYGAQLGIAANNFYAVINQLLEAGLKDEQFKAYIKEELKKMLQNPKELKENSVLTGYIKHYYGDPSASSTAAAEEAAPFATK